MYTFIHALSLQPLHFRHFSLRLFPRLLLPLDICWIMLCCMIVLPVMSLPHQHQGKSLCNFERAWQGSRARLRKPLKEHPGSGAALGSQAISGGPGFASERLLHGCVRGQRQLPYHCPPMCRGTAALTSLSRCSEGAERAPCTSLSGAVRMPWV